MLIRSSYGSAMTTKRNRAGKAIKEGTAPTEGGAVNYRLPPRLFATDRYPSNMNNCYSSLEFLLLVRDVLEGSAEMERLLCSCFGPLFRLTVRRCAFSAKLVHGMLSRQLVTKKRFEMWPVFGEGSDKVLACRIWTCYRLTLWGVRAGYEVEDQTKPKKTDYVFWDKLFGGRCNLTIEDLAAMVAGDKTLSPAKKLRICLIIIVDGVLMPKTKKPKPTLKYVKLWGRESFWWTISIMIPHKKVLGKFDDPEGVFCAKLRPESKFLVGFPLALQLWAFEAIPVLLDRLGDDDSVTLLSYVGDKLPTHTGLVLTDVLHAERSPKLAVLPMMEVDEDREDGWGVFDCEIFDSKVAYMVELVKSGYKFKTGEWGGGDAAEPLYVHNLGESEVKRKIRKLTHKEEAGPILGSTGPLMKQRRLSRYFSRKGKRWEDKYEALLGTVEGIKKELGRLNKVVEKQGRVLRKYKAKTIGKFSSSKLRGLRRRKKSVVAVETGILFGESDPGGSDNNMEELGVCMGIDNRPHKVAEHAEMTMKEGDGVPLLYKKKRDETAEAHVVLYGSGSNTFYVTEEEVGRKTGGCVVGNAYLLSYVEQDSNVGADVGIPGGPAAYLNRLVGVIKRGVIGPVAEEEVGKDMEVGVATKRTDGQSMEVDGNARKLGEMMEDSNEKSGEASKVEEAKGR
ncbi:hypothetical protein Bca52824_039324 [Brassica carinata]|uniref:DUF1985 domain-containing protein n=1 Tax=Brassica carinata TaxID=52824 RepID=A0A8X7RQX4_BRACI|nr:hypothetical protein Bca52824_039324 [Brassica carinata]